MSVSREDREVIFLRTPPFIRLPKRAVEVIERLSEKKPKMFESTYNRLRLEYMAKYASLLQELAKHNIQVESDAKITDEYTFGGHIHYYLTGVQHTEPTNWDEASKMLAEAHKELRARKAYLEAFRKAAERNPAVKLAEIQSEVSSGIQMIEIFLKQRGGGLIEGWGSR